MTPTNAAQLRAWLQDRLNWLKKLSSMDGAPDLKGQYSYQLTEEDYRGAANDVRKTRLYLEGLRLGTLDKPSKHMHPSEAAEQLTKALLLCGTEPQPEPKRPTSKDADLTAQDVVD